VKQSDERLALLVLLLQTIVPQHPTFLPRRKRAEQQGFRSSPILLKLRIIVRRGKKALEDLGI
jgi:hypothetical protein